MESSKLILRLLITYLFMMIAIILGVVIVYGEFQQIIDLSMIEKMMIVLFLIVPYTKYILYTHTKYYQFPQLSNESRKMLKDIIKKDKLLPIFDDKGLSIGSLWLKVKRFGIIAHQNKYIKLDLLAGFCIELNHGSLYHTNRCSTIYYFVNNDGKIISMNGCLLLSVDEKIVIEKEILSRSNAVIFKENELKSFAKKCRKSH